MAALTKRIVCLAKSTKPGGRCVAGIELKGKTQGGWIRPVSNASGAAVPAPVVLASAQSLELLDTIDIEFQAHCPSGCQVENYLYDSLKRWEKVGEFDPADLHKLANSPETIWGLGTGWLNDRVTYPESEQLSSSLLLVGVENARMVVTKWPQGDTSVSALFDYNGTKYSFKVTDPEQKQRYIQSGEGEHALGNEVHVCASLAEPHEGFRHKLAAAVFTERGPA